MTLSHLPSQPFATAQPCVPLFLEDAWWIFHHRRIVHCRNTVHCSIIHNRTPRDVGRPQSLQCADCTLVNLLYSEFVRSLGMWVDVVVKTSVHELQKRARVSRSSGSRRRSERIGCRNIPSFFRASALLSPSHGSSLLPCSWSMICTCACIVSEFALLQIRNCLTGGVLLWTDQRTHDV